MDGGRNETVSPGTTQQFTSTHYWKHNRWLLITINTNVSNALNPQLRMSIIFTRENDEHCRLNVKGSHSCGWKSFPWRLHPTKLARGSFMNDWGSQSDKPPDINGLWLAAKMAPTKHAGSWRTSTTPAQKICRSLLNTWLQGDALPLRSKYKLCKAFCCLFGTLCCLWT